MDGVIPADQSQVGEITDTFQMYHTDEEAKQWRQQSSDGWEREGGAHREGELWDGGSAPRFSHLSKHSNTLHVVNAPVNHGL